MDRVTFVCHCLGLLGLLLLQGMINVEGRSIFTSENSLNPTNDAEIQNKILALLPQKSLLPAERNDPLGLKLANKLAVLKELQLLSEDLELERKITASLVEDGFVTRKRGEPCFWKYCV